MARGILLIEDEQVLAKNIKRYLERHGYETVLAETAAEGIRLFDQSELDLVLLDLNLPDMHGIQVLNELRSATRERSWFALPAMAACKPP